MQIFELACQPHFADEMGRICRCGCLLQHGWQFWASTFCGLRFDQISRPVLAFFVDPTALFFGVCFLNGEHFMGAEIFNAATQG